MTISVCIPTYNQAQYLSGCIESVLQQTLRPDEIIISNDCSIDDTKELLEKLAVHHDILKVVNQPVNLGMNRNTDACLRMAKGKIIVKLDSDDKLLPTYIEILNDLLLKYPDAGYAHAAVQEIDENENNTRVRFLARKEEYIDAETSLKKSLKGYKVAANIIMFKREALEKVNFISSRMNFAEDFFLSVALANAGYGNVYSPQVLSCYRVWSDSGNVRQKRKLDEIRGLLQVTDEAILPAFNLRGWNLSPVKKMKKRLALTHADSLGWKVYSREERDELKTELYKLSDERIVRFYTWCYLNGFGDFFSFYGQIRSKAKIQVKKLLY